MGSSLEETSAGAAAGAARAHTCFVVALGAEARPLVDRFCLERRHIPGSASEPFEMFEGEGVALVVSGVGKLLAAAATTFAHACLALPPETVWLNVGIAGHRRRPTGETVLANKVTDAGSDECWFPPLPLAPPAPGVEVRTVERVELEYPDAAVYEMEAAGFCAAASRLASAELIQVLKVISDNAASPVDGIDRRRIEAWMEGSLETVTSLRTCLLELAAELAATARTGALLAAPFRRRWHFTASQAGQLHRLLERWCAVAGEEEPWRDRWSALRSAREVLARIEEEVEGRFFAGGGSG